MSTMLQQKTNARRSELEVPRSDGVRVVTLNLFGQQGGWAARRTVLIDGLHTLRPDLVAFQEVITSDTYDQVVDLLGPEFHVAHQTLNLLGDGNHGASIASRWPMGEVWDVDLRVPLRTLDYPCGTLVAEIRAPEPLGPLLFVSHGPWYPWWAEYEREQQAVMAAQFIEERVAQQRQHVIIGGDFNATADTASMRFWSGRQSLNGMSVCYQDVWEWTHPAHSGHTFSPRNPLAFRDEPFLKWGRRIDHILVHCGDHGPTLDAVSCTLVFDEPVNDVWASDHFGIVADLIVPTQRSADSS